MKKTNVTLKDVSAVYSGPEGVLWELIMGEQIHVGGFGSSMALAQKADIKEGQKVLDLCSALGAGLRFLVKNFKVQGFGLDGTEHMVNEAVRRTEQDGLKGSIEYKLGDVTAIPWAENNFDVVWGEDAWCYVVDKDKLISEAARVLKKGGTISFTDWVEGPKGLSDEDAERINTFMKFPYMESQKGYEALLKKHGLTLKVSDDLTSEFADYIQLYLDMVSKQLSFDALRIIGWDMNMMQAIGGEMAFMLQKAREGGFGRTRIVGVKE
ncbi:MAG: methyltransferase domain-containing protein [Nitrospirae bacterium]|nr:MAG: methyltransferase domain-containing protein [Nitrospirota bacterium]